MYALLTDPSPCWYKSDFEQCSNCDLECKKASSIVMASAVEPREIVAEGAEKQGATSENNASDDIELADSKNLFMKPSCPKYCVGNRQACKEVRTGPHSQVSPTDMSTERGQRGRMQPARLHYHGKLLG